MGSAIIFLLFIAIAGGVAYAVVKATRTPQPGTVRHEQWKVEQRNRNRRSGGDSGFSGGFDFGGDGGGGDGGGGGGGGD